VAGSIKIRKAQLHDLKPMAKLLEELFSIEDDFRVNFDLQYQALTLLFHSKNATLLVAKINNKVVGMLTMQLLISTAMGGSVGLIEDMIVTDEYRGCGVGKTLMNALIEEANHLGYQRLSLGADVRNTPALKFYKPFGFEMSHMGLMYRL
jgi:ribosomal protein S18 acetylase RimI-like enzyme